MGTVIVRNNPDYVDTADRWAGFGSPRIPVVEIEGPARVEAGSEAMFDVSVTFESEPYPAADLEGVTYLLFDSSGGLVGEGVAEPVADGQYRVTLIADQTGALPTGANRLEVVVVSRLVAIPVSAAIDFVTP